MLAKVAVVLLYLRIWTNEAVKPGFRLVCWATIAVLLSTVLAFDFALIFQCSPISYAWTKVASDETGRCVDISPLMYTFGALDICFNLLVFVLPVGFAVEVCFSFQPALLILVDSERIRPQSFMEEQVRSIFDIPRRARSHGRCSCAFAIPDSIRG